MNDLINITWARYEKACNEMQQTLEDNDWMETIKAKAVALVQAIEAVEKAEEVSR